MLSNTSPVRLLTGSTSEGEPTGLAEHRTTAAGSPPLGRRGDSAGGLLGLSRSSNQETAQVVARHVGMLIVGTTLTGVAAGAFVYLNRNNGGLSGMLWSIFLDRFSTCGSCQLSLNALLLKHIRTHDRRQVISDLGGGAERTMGSLFLPAHVAADSFRSTIDRSGDVVMIMVFDVQGQSVPEAEIADALKARAFSFPAQLLNRVPYTTDLARKMTPVHRIIAQSISELNAPNGLIDLSRLDSLLRALVTQVPFPVLAMLLTDVDWAGDTVLMLAATSPKKSSERLASVCFRALLSTVVEATRAVPSEVEIPRDLVLCHQAVGEQRRPRDGKTVLHQVCERLPLSKDPRTLASVIDVVVNLRSVNCDVKDRKGNTALHLLMAGLEQRLGSSAAPRGSAVPTPSPAFSNTDTKETFQICAETARRLVAVCGASSRIENNAGLSPYYIAARSGWRGMCAALADGQDYDDLPEFGVITED